MTITVYQYPTDGSFDWELANSYSFGIGQCGVERDLAKKTAKIWVNVRNAGVPSGIFLHTDPKKDLVYGLVKDKETLVTVSSDDSSFSVRGVLEFAGEGGSNVIFINLGKVTA